MFTFLVFLLHSNLCHEKRLPLIHLVSEFIHYAPGLTSADTQEPESSVRSAAESDTSQGSPRSWVEPRGGGRGPGGGPERHAPGPSEQKPHRDPSFQLGVYSHAFTTLFVCMYLTVFTPAKCLCLLTNVCIEIRP